MVNIRKTLTRSVKPKKQRLLVFTAPLHIKQKFMRSPLSKELQKKYKKRNALLRKGDEVKVMRGTFKGKTGNVSEVMLKKTRVIVEGIENIKTDGAKAHYPMHPSKLMITKLGTEDKTRKKIMERK